MTNHELIQTITRMVDYDKEELVADTLRMAFDRPYFDLDRVDVTAPWSLKNALLVVSRSPGCHCSVKSELERLYGFVISCESETELREIEAAVKAVLAKRKGA